MKLLIGLFVVGTLFACNGDDTDKDTISIKDLMGETGQIEDTVEAVIDTVSMAPTGPVAQFILNQLGGYDTSSTTEFHPVDRFTFNQREKVLFKSKIDVEYGESMVTPRAEFFYYTFSDTTKTKNAFYNWLDGFSEEGDEVKLGVDANAVKTPPRFALIYDTVIVAVNYRCEDRKHNWSPLEDSIVSRFGRNYNYRMEIGCGGPLRWK